MDALTLLDRARAAGLTVLAEGDRLVVRGPRTAEALVQDVLSHKEEVLAILADSDQGHGASSDPEHLLLDVTSLRDAWRRAVRELGEAAGWPRVPLPPPRSVAPGELAWRRFIDRAAIYDLQRAAAALHQQLGSVGTPEDGLPQS